MESCDDDPAHARHVAKLAVKLFDELAPLHGLNGDQRELLYGGAMLCNVGQVVSHARHHVHAYYVIRETDRLNANVNHGHGYSGYQVAVSLLIQ